MADKPGPTAASPQLGPRLPPDSHVLQAQVSDGGSEASYSPYVRRPPDSPVSLQSPTSIGGDSARRRGSIVNVQGDFIKSRKEDAPQRTYSQKEKYRRLGYAMMTSNIMSNAMAVVVLHLG